MTTAVLLFYIAMLIFFSMILSLKAVYVFSCVKTNQFTTMPKIYAGTAVVTIWFLYVTIEAIVKGAGI